MQNLSNQKLQLKQLVTGENGLSAAIESLKLLLPSTSPKYNGLLQLEADFNQVKLNEIKGIVSEEQFRLAINQLRERLLQFIDLLDDKDFMPPIAPVPIAFTKRSNYVPLALGGLAVLLLVVVLIWRPWQSTPANLQTTDADAAIQNQKDITTPNQDADDALEAETSEATTGSDFGGPAMVFVKGGMFEMGCKPGRDLNCPANETPLHSVTVKDFYISKHEATMAGFRAFKAANPDYVTDAETAGHSNLWMPSGDKRIDGINWQYNVIGKKRNRKDYKDYPVVYVSANDAEAYVQWMSKATGKKYRLPTEVEWEYAARGGSQSKNYNFAGGNNLNEVGWFSENSERRIHPIATKKPNELGIYDMSSNVWEWCKAENGDGYVLRGGGFSGTSDLCRIAFRTESPYPHCNFVGFRLVME